MLKSQGRIRTLMRFAVIKVALVVLFVGFEFFKSISLKAVYVAMYLSITNTYTGSISIHSTGVVFVDGTGYTTGLTQGFNVNCSTGCTFSITGDIIPSLITGNANSGVGFTGFFDFSGGYGVKYVYALINKDREILPPFVFIFQYQNSGAVPPVPTPSPSLTSGGGGRGSLGLFRDVCPRGDFSATYYDRSCGEGFLGSAPLSGSSLAQRIFGDTHRTQTGRRTNLIAYSRDPCLFKVNQPDTCTNLKYRVLSNLKREYPQKTIKQRLKYLTAVYHNIDSSSRIIVTHRTLRTFLYNKLRRKPESTVRKVLLGLENRLSAQPQDPRSTSRFKQSLFLKEIRFILKKKVP